MSLQRRKVFISHYGADRIEVDAFIRNFSHVFIPKVLGANSNDGFINSADTDYVMQRIRELYLQDSTVTIVLIGACSHSRRYIDWEIKSSLKQGGQTPNGLIGIVLPSRKNMAVLPERLKANWNKSHLDCYARYWPYPESSDILSIWIEDAHLARTVRADTIKNAQGMMKYNSKCDICGVTH